MTPTIHTFALSVTHAFCIACQCLEVLSSILTLLFFVPSSHYFIDSPFHLATGPGAHSLGPGDV